MRQNSGAPMAIASREWGRSKHQISGKQGRNALHGNVHIGPRIAIHIHLQHATAEAQLPGDTAESGTADESEGLITSKGGIGIDQREINPIPGTPIEIQDAITVAANSAFGQGHKAEKIAPRATGQFIA
ncbi:MAG: hypothetical protein RIS83_934, partial [Pseudomonadota bacterium]